MDPPWWKNGGEGIEIGRSYWGDRTERFAPFPKQQRRRRVGWFWVGDYFIR